jgi:hypothetical protein
MKEKIQQIIISAQLGGISSIEATHQILDLFAVSGQCEHPYNSIMKGNTIKPC